MIDKIITDNRVSFSVNSIINEGSQGLIYRVTRRNKTYAAKVFKSITPNLWTNIVHMSNEGAPNISEKASYVWPLFTFSDPAKGYIMEYIDMNKYKSVHELVNLEGLSIVERFKIGLNLLKSIHALHSQKGLFFGDISASNVMIDPDDFSVKLVDTDGITNKSHDVVGTPGYMNKETLTNQNPSFDSDIFATYVLFHEIIFNHHPYYGEFARKFNVYDEGINQAILNDAGYIFTSPINTIEFNERPYVIWEHFLNPKMQSILTSIFNSYPPIEVILDQLDNVIDGAKQCDCGELTISSICSVCFSEVD